jgi:hypothetical protein
LQKCSTLHRRIRIFGFVSFAITLLGPLPEVFAFVAKHMFHTNAYDNLTRSIGRVPYLFAGISAAIAGFAAQENFARLAQVSSSVSKRLHNLVAEIRSQKLDIDELRQAVGEAIDITVQEHAGWVLLTSLRDLDPPS